MKMLFLIGIVALGLALFSQSQPTHIQAQIQPLNAVILHEVELLNNPLHIWEGSESGRIFVYHSEHGIPMSTFTQEVVAHSRFIFSVWIAGVGNREFIAAFTLTSQGNHHFIQNTEVLIPAINLSMRFNVTFQATGILVSSNVNFNWSPTVSFTVIVNSAIMQVREPQEIDTSFTIFVQDLDGNQLGYIELDFVGSFEIHVGWLALVLPSVAIAGQDITGFFIVNNSVVGNQLMSSLVVNNLHSRSVTLALNYVQIIHSVTFQMRHGDDVVEIGVLGKNWGDIIVGPEEFFPALPVTRGWEFQDWRHSPYERTSDWNIVPIIGTPITNDFTFTANFRQLPEFQVRFMQPEIQSWGISHRIFAQVRLYSNEVVNLENVMTFYPSMPLLQYPINIFDGYTWDGRWISHSGFDVGQILTDEPLYRPWGVHWTYINFIPLLVPQEFQVSFMAWDGEYIISIQTVGGYIDLATIPAPPDMDGREFSHWFNANLNLDSRILQDTHFWAVYVSGQTPDNGYDAESGVEMWMLLAGGAIAILLVVLLASTLTRVLKPRRKRRY